MDGLKAEYEKIKNQLEELLDAEIINEYTKCTLIDMSNKVLEHIARRYENVREGVKSIMGGKILEYEAKAIRNEGWMEGKLEGKKEGKKEGKLEGKKEGKLEGKLEMLFELVKSNLLSMKDAAFQAKLPEEVFEEKLRDYKG